MPSVWQQCVGRTNPNAHFLINAAEVMRKLCSSFCLCNTLIRSMVTMASRSASPSFLLLSFFTVSTQRIVKRQIVHKTSLITINAVENCHLSNWNKWIIIRRCTVVSSRSLCLEIAARCLKSSESIVCSSLVISFRHTRTDRQTDTMPMSANSYMSNTNWRFAHENAFQYIDINKW